MAPRSYTIGQISRLTRVSVRRLRFYADKGLLPPVERTQSGYRLFSDEDILRIDLIRVLRGAGLGLQAIGDLLASRLSLKQVLTLRLAEVEAQLSAQKLVAGALRAALASSQPSNDDLRRVWMMTNLSQSERAMAVERFFQTVAENAGLEPGWQEWMVKMSTPKLPDEPTAGQLDAWLELSALMASPAFVEAMRENGVDSLYSSRRMNFELFSATQKDILPRALKALNDGEAPESPVGQAIAGSYLSGWAVAMGVAPDAGFFALMHRKHLRHRPKMARYWELVSLLGALPDRTEPTPEWLWIEAATNHMLRTRLG